MVSPSVQASLLLASPDIPVVSGVPDVAYHLILMFPPVLTPLKLLASPLYQLSLVLLSGLLLMYSYRILFFPGFPAMARDPAADFFN
jgi:hypothetical protein